MMVLNEKISGHSRQAGQARSKSSDAAATRPVPVIGLVGGIGSGKSTVAKRLATRRPVAVLDADEIGHHVLAEPETQQQLRDRFGDSIFDGSGNVDRAKLGHRVFGVSADRQQARSDLEQIVHPRIRAELEQKVKQLRADGKIEAIILDAAILLETGWNHLTDMVVFVDCPLEQRLARVATGRNWDITELRKREASQYSLPQKQNAADATLDNSHDPTMAVRQLETILDQITHTRPSKSLTE